METYRNANVLVTGGAGFVGSNLVRALIAEGAKVTVVDNFFTGSLRNIEGVSDRLDLINTSVCDKTMKIMLANKDYVFHLAARNIIASTADPHSDYEDNIGGTLNILLGMREANVKRMVYTSSASVYGNPRCLPINEDDPINLLTPYAVSKYAGEGYCMAFYESYKLPVVVMRLSNVYGPYQDPDNPYCGVVAKFMDSAMQSMPLVIHGDGLSTRDFTFVEDVVKALMAAGLNPRAEGEAFNVATGIETSVADLASEIRTLYTRVDNFLHLGDHVHGLEVKYIERRDIDNVRRRVMNIEKIRRKLGWMPTTKLHNGLMVTSGWLYDKKINVKVGA